MQLKEKTWYVTESGTKLYFVGTTPSGKHVFCGAKDETFHYNSDLTHCYGTSPNIVREYTEPPTALELAEHIRKNVLSQPCGCYTSPDCRKAVEMADAIIAAAK